LMFVKAVSPSFLLPSPSSMTSTAHTCRLHTPITNTLTTCNASEG
jgi:hypothetical protein